jgi:hypothetical protein
MYFFSVAYVKETVDVWVSRTGTIQDIYTALQEKLQLAPEMLARVYIFEVHAARTIRNLATTDSLSVLTDYGSVLYAAVHLTMLC